MMIQGGITALVTPIRNGKVDEDSFRNLIESQIAAGIDGLVPCGTTGESATLSHAEHKQVVEFTVKVVNKRVPVIAGAGSNNTLEAIALTQHARQAGADAALHISPYYNKPTQEGLYQHFAAVANAVDFPIIVYNIQSRTGVNILPETFARMAELPQVVGIKEASGDVAQMAAMKQLGGDRIALLSGDDSLTLPVLAIGGVGVISVLSNILPAEVSKLCRLWREGKAEEARSCYYYLLDLSRDLFLETNPILTKTALKMMGVIESDELRLPMCAPKEETRQRLIATLKAYNLV